METKEYIQRRCIIALLGIVGVCLFFRGENGASSMRRATVVFKTHPQEPTCPEVRHATLHDRRNVTRDKYEKAISAVVYNLQGPPQAENDVPKLTVLKGDSINYIIWDMAHPPEASAWTNDKAVEGLMYVKPRSIRPPQSTLTGDFVCFLNWAESAFGHFNNHHLPSIAWLKEQVPVTTRFILHDNKLSRKVIQFLDPIFYERVVWVDVEQQVKIRGSLTVPVLHTFHMHQGDMRPMASLRRWIYSLKSGFPKTNVVFYSRKNARHRRALAHEEEVLLSLQKVMNDFGMDRNSELIIYNGKRKDGTAMSMEEQYETFRSAHTIVGSHGAGLLGNMVWTDPFPKSCEERTKVLEFIVADDSTEVQNNPWSSSYINFRKWPLDYHVVAYTPGSSQEGTYIDLEALQDALRAMWNTTHVSNKHR